MEVTNLFSKGADILKTNYLVAVPLVAVGIIVSILSYAAVGGAVAGGMMGMGGGINLGAILGAAFLISIIGGLLNFAGAAMTYIVAEDAIAGKVDLNKGLQRTLDNIANILITSIILVVVMIVLAITIIGPVIALYLLMFSIVIVSLEKQSPVDSLKGSFELVKANIADTIVFAVIAIVVMVVAGIIGGIFGFIPLIGGIIISPAISGTATAYVSIVLVLLYRELKPAPKKAAKKTAKK